MPVPCNLLSAHINLIELEMVLTVKLHHLFHVHLTMLYQGLARAFDVQMDNLGGSPVVPVHGADSCFVMSCVVSE